VWIIADDMSPDTGAYGLAQVKTPHLDQLAAVGEHQHPPAIAGVASAMKQRAAEAGRTLRVIGVQSSQAAAYPPSITAGKPTTIEVKPTIADGIAVRTPVPEALEDMKGLVDDVVLVSEEALLRGMKIMFDRAGLVIEPAGIAGVAAVLEHQQLRSERLATVLCGSNLTSEQINTWLR
jgi:threonine dehydratase